MAAGDDAAFGMLLRRYRLAAGLSQEALAERAGISTDAVSALERGRRKAPRLETVGLLAGALDLDHSHRAALLATVTGARGPDTATMAPPAPLPSPGVLSPLPTAPTLSIGRERDEAAVTRLLRQGGARLLTLIGPGGVGKTRLALSVATALSDAYADGVAFVDLSALRDHTLVAATMAQSLGLRESGARSPRDLLLAELHTRDMLVVLDNVEQVIEAASLVAALLAACPRLMVLATSRIALRVRAEILFPVSPLEAPPPQGATDRPLPVGRVAGYAAVRLFVARARAVERHFELDEGNAATVADICRRLDGLPLAIELAAPRLAILPPAALLARLERQLTVLTGGARDVPARQQTLRATIDWSYELLTMEERALFRRLAVFASGCAPDAAEAVCQADVASAASAGIATDEDMTPLAGDVVDGLTSLVEKSLLRTAAGARGEPRLEMLETIRAYGLERLAESGEAEMVRRRHAAYYRALAKEAEPSLTGSGQQAWLERLEREHDNLRAALHWARESGETAYGLQFAGALWRFWYLHGHLSEGRTWLDGLLSRPPTEDDPAAARATALIGAGVLAYTQADYERAARLCEDSLALYQALSDKRGIAVALNILGNVAMNQGDDGRAVTLSEASLALHRELGDRRGIAVALNNLGFLTLARGDYSRAVALCEESLTLNKRLGDARGISSALNNLADAARAQGHYGRAASLYEECLSLYHTMGDKASLAGCLEDMAEVVRARGEPERAARLLGAATTLREAIGAPLPAASRVGYERGMAALHTTLGESAFAEAWAAGAALSSDEAVDEARALLE